MSTRRALMFSYLDRYASLAVFLVTSVIIARLLAPAEFGIYSITAVVVGFVAPFRDLGASQYLINEKTLTPDHVKSVWALQLGLGLLIAVVIFTVRHWVAAAYHHPEIADIMVVLALNSLAMPFGALTGAWLSRELRFDKLAVIRFSGAVVGAVTSIGLAWSGRGAISLAYGGLATSLTSALVGMFFRPAEFPWLPGLARIRQVLGFGTSISLNTLFRLAYKGTPELVAGRLLGMHQTGQLARADGFASLFEKLVMESIGAVALPAFASLHRSGGDLRAAYVRNVEIITAVGWAGLAFMALLSAPLISLLYGDQWQEAIPVARVFCLSLMTTLPIVLAPALLIATGCHWRLVQLQAANAALQCGLAVVGAGIGLLPLAFAMLATSASALLLWSAIVRRLAAIDSAVLLRALGRSAVVAAAAALAPAALWLAGPAASRGTAALGLVLAAAGAAAGFALAARAVGHPVWAECSSLARRARAGLMSA